MKSIEKGLSPTEKSVRDLVLTLAFFLGLLINATIGFLKISPEQGAAISRALVCGAGCRWTGVQCVCLAQPRTEFRAKDFGRGL